MDCIKRSAAFIELKYFLLNKFLPFMSKEQVLDFLDVLETRLLASYRPDKEHRSVLLQNLNSLKTTLQTLYMLRKMQSLIRSVTRIKVLSEDIEAKQAEILEKYVHQDFDLLIASCYRVDLFGNNIFWYLSSLKPKKILNTQVIQKIITLYWKSSYFTSKGSLFFQSTCI